MPTAASTVRKCVASIPQNQAKSFPRFYEQFSIDFSPLTQKVPSRPPRFWTFFVTHKRSLGSSTLRFAKKCSKQHLRVVLGQLQCESVALQPSPNAFWGIFHFANSQFCCLNFFLVCERARLVTLCLCVWFPLSRFLFPKWHCCTTPKYIQFLIKFTVGPRGRPAGGWGLRFQVCNCLRGLGKILTFPTGDRKLLRMLGK